MAVLSFSFPTPAGGDSWDTGAIPLGPVEGTQAGGHTISLLPSLAEISCAKKAFLNVVFTGKHWNSPHMLPGLGEEVINRKVCLL